MNRFDFFSFGCCIKKKTIKTQIYIPYIKLVLKKTEKILEKVEKFKVYFQCGRWNFANKLHVGSCFYDSLYVERRKLKTP